MGFNNFRANILVRVLILFALCLFLAWGLLNTTWIATPFLCIALIVVCVDELIRYAERTTREFTNFLSFVAHHDYSTPIPQAYKGRIFGELQSAYRLLSEEYRRLNLQKAANLEYLEAVVEHVSIALCCLDERGQVRMMNKPARQLFGIPHLNSWHTFARIDPRLPELLQTLGDGERTLLAVTREDDNLQLLLYATTFELLGQRYKLVSFQNIRDELDRQETDSWQKLIRVLTHEIMNSVTPIISLSGLVRETMVDDTTTPATVRALTPQQQDDMQRSVTAIHSRSRGLLDFVRAYRSFTRLPEPAFAEVEVRALLERVRVLMSPELDAGGICLDLQCPADGLSIRADAGQTEQVLINLIRNAIDALAGRPAPQIVLRAARNTQEEILLQVIDNGSGIAAEHLDSIFVPFFTTKRNGTGVGLSLSRQIVQMNRGLISVRSVPGEGCAFTLKFPDSAPVSARTPAGAAGTGAALALIMLCAMQCGVPAHAAINRTPDASTEFDLSKANLAICIDQSQPAPKRVASCTLVMERAKPRKTEMAKLYVARGVALDAEDKRDDAIADFTRAIALDPHDAIAYSNRATLYLGSSRLEQAIADLSAVIRIKPDDGMAFYTRGAAYERNGEVDKALDDYRSAVHLQPAFVPAIAALGRLLKGTDPEGALSALSEATRLDPRSPALRARAMLYLSLGRLDQALGDFNQVIANDGTDSLAYLDRGATNAKLGRFANAIADYSRSIELAPSAAAYVNRGNAYATLQQPDKALADFNATLSLEPMNVLALLGRADVSHARKLWTASLDDYARVIAIDPSNAIPYFKRGNVHLDLREFAAAITDYSQSLKLDPRQPVALYNRSLAAARIGHRKEAAEDWRLAISLDPSLVDSDTNPRK